MFSSRKTSAPSSGLVTKSLRFRSSASAYLSRTPSSATNRKTWTWSGWIKFGRLTGYSYIFGATSDAFANNFFLIQINNSASTMALIDYNSAYSLQLIPSQVFADPSAWYHIVFAMDTTQATASNRAKLYVNGNQVNSFTTATYPALNANTNVNNNILHTHSYSSYGMDGYLTEINFIDGQQLTPSSFGVTNATTGQWSPAIYSGSYGTNGFHLTFANTASTTTLGYDTSGNSNNWTTNNISLTAGSTYDSMNDVPVAYSATAANYATLNPLSVSTTYISILNGNLQQGTVSGGASYQEIPLTFSVNFSGSNKWYVEVNTTTVANTYYPSIGISPTTKNFLAQNVQCGDATGGTAYMANGQKYNNASLTSYGSAFTSGDVVGIAVDEAAGTIVMYKNNVSQGALASSLTGLQYITVTAQASANFYLNAGQQAFAYTAPSGYKALNTYNLPTPSIAQGNKYMDATLYTGTGASASITNTASFKPDLVWIKSRSASTDNKLTDSVRGVTKGLISDTTGAETTDTQGLTAFNSNGFTLGTDTNYNNTSATYVGWQWQAGAGTSGSNTNGSITSTVSANTTSGFSIVTYTGTGSNATVGHGLGVAPSMIIGKARNSTVDWRVYHTSIGAANYLAINTTAASASGATWNSTTPTSTVFTVGGGSNMNADSSTTYVAYCFAPIAGYSAFGSYTGNGSTSGPFIYCGFQPKFIMTKRTNTTGDWFIWDSARNTYNSLTLALYPDLNNAEYNYGAIWNFTSNGFYPVSSSIIANNSGDTYIYMAFASNPFKYSNAF